MLEISSAGGLDNQTRQLAAIYLKNNIVRYWAPRDDTLTAVGPDEKAHIRKRCTTSGEPVALRCGAGC